MRTLVDIPEAALRRLDALAREQKVSRAELVRRAVDEFTAKDRSIDQYFGLWRDWPVDGVDYQRAIRAEWDRGDSE